jgi:hypothetical protein
MLRLPTRRLNVPAALFLAGALQACDPITAPGPEEPLVVDARTQPGHIHSFETDVTFMVKVTDPRTQAAVEDFTLIRAELSPIGAENWNKQIPLSFDGTEYTGTTKFTANGTFDARIVSQRPGQNAPVELHRYETPLASVRPHFDAGGYRVEFETNTAEYPVAGEPITVRFLIMEDVPNPRPPVTGLAGVTIHCGQGTDVIHPAVESPPGTYSATHTFTTQGDASARIEFIGLDLNPAEVEIPLEVF